MLIDKGLLRISCSQQSIIPFSENNSSKTKNVETRIGSKKLKQINLLAFQTPFVKIFPLAYGATSTTRTGALGKRLSNHNSF